MLNVRVFSPFLALFSTWFVLHFAFGYQYYLESPILLSVTIYFFAILIIVSSIGSKTKKLNLQSESLKLFLQERRAQLFRIMIILGSIYGLAIFILGSAKGLSVEELRVYKNTILPPILSIPMNSLSLAGFCLLLSRVCIQFSLKVKVKKLDLFLLCLAFLSSAGTGTRALMAPYLWFFAVIPFYYTLIKPLTIFILGASAAFSLAALKLIRLIASDSEGKLSYYIENQVYNPDNFVESLFNILKIHLNDNPWRAFMVYEYVPERLDFQYGKSLFFDFYSMLPGEQMNPHVLLSWNVMYGAAEARGYPPTLLAQGWLDFGFLGAILYSTCFALILGSFYLVSKKFATPSNSIIYFYLVFCGVLAWYGAFSLLFITFFCVFIKLGAKARVLY